MLLQSLSFGGLRSAITGSAAKRQLISDHKLFRTWHNFLHHMITNN
jgi:hypothetical protein